MVPRRLAGLRGGGRATGGGRDRPGPRGAGRAGRGRAAVGLIALAGACFAVSSVPAGTRVVRAGAPLVVAGGAATATLLAFVLPPRFAPVAGRFGTYEVADGDGLATCRIVLRVRGEASPRGVRFDPARRRLAFRLEGERRELTAARARTAPDRQVFLGDVRAAAVGRPPVEAVARFVTPPGLPFSSSAPATLVLATLDTFADTSSIVQRTPELFARCRRLAREVGPAAMTSVVEGVGVAR